MSIREIRVTDVKLYPRNNTPEGDKCSESRCGSFISWIDKVAMLQEAVSVSDLVWTAGKAPPSKGFDPRTFKHVDSRYTSYTVLANFLSYEETIICNFTIHPPLQIF
jgi:hypothetical protein